MNALNVRRPALYHVDAIDKDHPRVRLHQAARDLAKGRFSRSPGSHDAEHHPFTAPVKADESLLETEPGKVQGRHYDVVCNGYEIGGGSIRIHTAELQRKVFKLLGYRDEEFEDRFGHMLNPGIVLFPKLVVLALVHDP